MKIGVHIIAPFSIPTLNSPFNHETWEVPSAHLIGCQRGGGGAGGGGRGLRGKHELQDDIGLT